MASPERHRNQVGALGSSGPANNRLGPINYDAHKSAQSLDIPSNSQAGGNSRLLSKRQINEFGELQPRGQISQTIEVGGGSPGRLSMNANNGGNSLLLKPNYKASDLNNTSAVTNLMNNRAEKLADQMQVNPNSGNNLNGGAKVDHNPINNPKPWVNQNPYI